MSTTTTITNPTDAVRAIGKGERLTEEAVAAITANIPEGFDVKARGAVADLVKKWACPDGNVPAQKTGPKGNQTTTDFGRGFDTLVSAVKRALKDEAAPTDWLRLVRQAAENAHGKGGKSHDEIVAAVVDALGGAIEVGMGDDGFPIALTSVDAA